MSDPKSTYGQPVDEPAVADNDVVGRAHEGLADAEAARHGAASDARDDLHTESTDRATEDPTVTRTENVEPATYDTEPIAGPDHTDAAVPVAPVGPASDATGQESWHDRARAQDAAAPAAASVYTDTSPAADPVRTTTYDTADDDEAARYSMYEASAATPAPTHPVESETVVAATPAAATAVVAASEPVAPQPIFVQAPEAPRPRGNRGAAAAIGLLAALSFAVLYLGVWLALGLLDGSIRGDSIVETLLPVLGTWALWVPVVVFFIAFWLLGAAINRGRWSAWVILGLLVGFAAYAGHILGQLFQEPFWTLTARQGGELIGSQLLAPLAIAAFVIGRELTIWFGAWVASRGRRVTELNDAAQREYERTLEAGPQLAKL